jgi:hypothetical protein
MAGTFELELIMDWEPGGVTQKCVLIALLANGDFRISRNMKSVIPRVIAGIVYLNWQILRARRMHQSLLSSLPLTLHFQRRFF